MPQVFISYSHDDRTRAEPLAERLRQDGYDAWIDVDGLIGGDVWERAIENAITEADALLVIVTPTSLKSEWVRKEIAIARDTRTRIIPLIMARFDDPVAALDDLGVADLQAIDFHTPGYKAGYEALKRALPPATPRPPEKLPSGIQVQQTLDHVSHSTVIAVQQVYAAPEAPADAESLHRAYLWKWLDQPWVKVSLADIADIQERVSLLDIYVPLPVDFSIEVKTEKGRIVDWWARPDEEPEGRAALAQLEEMGEKRSQQRDWPSLKVNEERLKAIVAGIQAKMDSREGQTEDGEHSWYMKAHDAASVQPRMVLVGDPGSGKTSFVRHLTLCLAGAQLRELGEEGIPDNASLEALRDWLLGAYTPIYIELRDLVARDFPSLPDDRDEPVLLPTIDQFWAYIEQSILGETLADYRPHLLRRLREGQAIILLDGLDEVADAADPRRRQQVQALVADLGRYPKARLIVTSRPHAYRQGEWELAGFGQTTLRPLYPSRLRELAEALFGVLMPDRAEAEVKAFFEALDTVPEDLRCNPLFFTLLAAIWLQTPGKHRLPETRGELYRKSLDLMLTKWTKRKGVSLSVADMLGLTPEQLRAALEAVACQVHGLGEAGGDTTEFHRDVLAEALWDLDEEIRPRMVWQHLEQRSGILISGRDKHFRFAHRSFQEYLAACYLTCQDRERRPPLPEADRFPAGLVRRVLEKPDLWRNVVLLAVDELVYAERENDLWRLLPELFRPLLRVGPTTERAQAAMLAAEIAAAHRLAEGAWDEYSPQGGILNGLREASLRLLTETSLAPPQRAEAGRLLGHLGDTRPGVAQLDENGVPVMDWVEIPGGPFLMGSDPQRDEFAREEWAKDELPQREFRLDTFYMARYPITYAQYEAFVNDTSEHREGAYAVDRYWTEAGLEWRGEKRQPEYGWNDPDWHIANHPVIGVTWYEALAFCRWLSEKTPLSRHECRALPPLPGGERWVIRLPRESEWERAARGREGLIYPWGNKYISGHANIDERYREAGPYYLGRTTAVGLYPQGASPEGLLDMSDNVWEWCLTKYPFWNYAEGLEAEDNDPEGDGPRVVRGGSWYGPQDFARAAYRGRGSPDDRLVGWGFRVCAAAPYSPSGLWPL